VSSLEKYNKNYTKEFGKHVCAFFNDETAKKFESSSCHA
jgi:hypothetical protein